MELPPDHRYSESDDSSSSLACDHHRGVPYSSEAYSSMRRRHPSHGRPSDYGSLANNRVRRSSRLTCQPATPSLDREKPLREGLWPDIDRIQAGRAGYRRCGLLFKWQGFISFDLIFSNSEFLHSRSLIGMTYISYIENMIVIEGKRELFYAK